jgi:hypothetical protein
MAGAEVQREDWAREWVPFCLAAAQAASWADCCTFFHDHSLLQVLDFRLI